MSTPNSIFTMTYRNRDTNVEVVLEFDHDKHDWAKVMNATRDRLLHGTKPPAPQASASPAQQHLQALAESLKKGKKA